MTRRTDRRRPHQERRPRAAESVGVVTRGRDGGAEERCGGRAGGHKVREIGHRGTYVRVDGPLNAQRFPRSCPPPVRTGAGENPAGPRAGAVVTPRRAPGPGGDPRSTGVPRRAAGPGRDPSGIRVPPAMPGPDRDPGSVRVPRCAAGLGRARGGVGVPPRTPAHGRLSRLAGRLFARPTTSAGRAGTALTEAR